MRSNQQQHPTSEKLSLAWRRKRTRSGILFLIWLMILASVGCGSSSKNSQTAPTLAGNWQFTMAAPTDGSFGGTASTSQNNCATGSSNPCPLVMGGFLLPKNGAITGAVTYSLTTAAQQPGTFPCSGSAPVTGSLSGQTVSLTMQAGPQSFVLTGTLSPDGTTMMGTYSSIATQGCGTAQSGLQWSASVVPSVSGQIQGFLHSRVSHIQFNAAFPSDQDFGVTGFLTQGENTGASSATVTGTLVFDTSYPCLGSTASVNGQVSGNSVVLQVIASNGLLTGQIGSSATSTQFQASPVALQSTPNGLILAGTNGYSVSSQKCPGANSPGDSGNICLALGGSSACSQPILMSPALLTFPPQSVGTSTSQTITVSNNDPTGATISGLTLSFTPQSGDTTVFGTFSDFTGLPNFTEADNCAPSPNTPFSLAAGQSCLVTISFTPQQSCPWLPFKSSSSSVPSAAGAPPTSCPLSSTGKLVVSTNNPLSNDTDTAYSVPVVGKGLSAISPFPVELDFGAEAPLEKSPPQSIIFTNQGASPVQILPVSNTLCGGPGQIVTLPRPLTPGLVSGLQVVESGSGFAAIAGDPSFSTMTYACDLDPTSSQPNFQISNDSCSGNTLAPQQSCSIQISFVRQAGTSLAAGLDFFLELNTLQCAGATNTNCEIDSGRFPVELKANLASPLRLTPAAGLEFGTAPVGQTSPPMSVTLFNDPNDPNPGTVNFSGNRVKGDYFETDNCGSSLAPGSSCTLNVTFTPQSSGADSGTVTLGYSLGNTPQLPQTIYLRGAGQ